MIVCWQTPSRPSLENETSMFWGQCQSCLADTSCFFPPVILSSRCKHLQLFTVKRPLCSPSLPVCFQRRSTCCTYCIVLPQRSASAAGRGLLAGLLARSLLAVRKRALIGRVGDVPPEAPCHRGTCQDGASSNKTEAYSTAA